MTDNLNPLTEQSSVTTANNELKNTELPLSNTLTILQEASLTLGGILKLRDLAVDIVSFIGDKITSEHVILYIRDLDDISFKYERSFPKLAIEHEAKLKQVYLNSYNAQNDPIVGKWLNGEVVKIDKQTLGDSQVNRILESLNVETLSGVPLLKSDKLMGILLIKSGQDKPLSDENMGLLNILSPHLATFLANAYTYESKVKQLEDGMHEVKILQQIDEELNATIQLPRVFRMIMDWALRFTNANAAALAIYNEEADTMRVMEHYGFELDNPQLDQLQQEHHGGVTHRVARNGQAEVVPDVSVDTDYRNVKHNTRSQLSVPIMREEQVIAVVSLESTRVNGFTNEHLEFVIKLAQRAGVAVDNARLFTATEMERQKLELILSNIKDIVILISNDSRILLINQSALAGLNLSQSTDEYFDRRFNEIIDHKELLEFYQDAVETGQGLMDEIVLPNGRTYHTQLSLLESIGWVLVMQDITYFKETDKLKSELLATASHDLKQPISVMRGYLDLLEMTNTFDERSQRFISSLNKAIHNMQTLIDELLDLARIESGLELEIEEVDLHHILLECIENNTQKAQEKSMTILTDIPENFPTIQGDTFRIGQIFNNLISNAIKYTPPEGEVRIYAQKQGKVVRVSVQDTGLGISPEDRAQIFDRFYRVRRPETDSIEGTGLGLAIVKSLIEAHQGEIDLISQLNKGSTFHVTLPLEL